MPTNTPPTLAGRRDRGYRRRTPAFTFYLGTHQPAWLARTGVPLFLSRRRLCGRRTFPRARGPWALDSGGYSELSLFGRWTVTAREYASEVRRYRDEIGRLEWAAAMDWMCEPEVLRATGLGIADHQRRTVDNYLELASLAPDLPWVPVLQGWTLTDYLRHAESYARAGVDLAARPLVGVGSVCRRHDAQGVRVILKRLADSGLRLHAFGVKASGLMRSAEALASADSMAWSFAARRGPAVRACAARHRRCNNCLAYALAWRRRTLEIIDADDPQAPAGTARQRLSQTWGACER